MNFALLPSLSIIRLPDDTNLSYAENVRQNIQFEIQKIPFGTDHMTNRTLKIGMCFVCTEFFFRPKKQKKVACSRTDLRFASWIKIRQCFFFFFFWLPPSIGRSALSVFHFYFLSQGERTNKKKSNSAKLKKMPAYVAELSEILNLWI